MPRLAPFRLGSLSSPGLLAVLLLTLAASGCKSDGPCGKGQYCECSGGDECVLSCGEEQCSMGCHDLRRCGAVCGDDCSSDCRKSDDCSISCGDRCRFTCADMQHCAAITGSDSDVTCSGMNDCKVEVGPGSVVHCTSLQNCTVVCHGACQVPWSGNSHEPIVTCAGGGAPLSSPGLVTCN